MSSSLAALRARSQSNGSSASVDDVTDDQAGRDMSAFWSPFAFGDRSYGADVPDNVRDFILQFSADRFGDPADLFALGDVSSRARASDPVVTTADGNFRGGGVPVSDVSPASDELPYMWICDIAPEEEVGARFGPPPGWAPPAAPGDNPGDADPDYVVPDDGAGASFRGSWDFV